MRQLNNYFALTASSAFFLSFGLNSISAEEIAKGGHHGGGHHGTHHEHHGHNHGHHGQYHGEHHNRHHDGHHGEWRHDNEAGFNANDPSIYYQTPQTVVVPGSTTVTPQKPVNYYYTQPAQQTTPQTQTTAPSSTTAPK